MKNSINVTGRLLPKVCLRTTYINIILLAILISLSATEVFAHASLKGKVYSKSTNEPEGIVELSGRSRRLGIDLSARHHNNSVLYVNVDVNTAKPRFIEEAEGQNYVPIAPTFTSTER